MRIFCEDTILNISPAYLQPGFAFGGSCLPKDLRSLLHMARANDLDVPLLAGTLRSNELVVRDVLDRISRAGRARSWPCSASASRCDTDDLRESPNVELAERLLGKGFEVRIYDPIVNPEPARRREPEVRRGPAAAPQPPAGGDPRGGARRQRHGDRRDVRAGRRRRAARRAAAADRRPLRPARRRRRTDPRLRGRSDGVTSTSAGADAGDRRRPRVLIIVQNLPVPFDRRVWLECQALTAAGYDVTRRLPAGQRTTRARGPRRRDDPARTGRTRPGGSAAGFVARVRLLVPGDGAARAAGPAAAGRFDVLQACNPPDIFWPIARWLRLRDRHPVRVRPPRPVPELFESRFPDGARLPRRGLLALERAHLPHGRPRHLDQRAPTRRSRSTAAARRTTTSPSSAPGPTRQAAAPARRTPRCARGRRAPRRLHRRDGPAGRRRHRRPRRRPRSSTCSGATDIAFTLHGRRRLLRRARRPARRARSAATTSSFPGRVPDETVVDVLSTADLGLSPDPKNPLNDVSTMNKTMEYMAFELPVVAFDLQETRVSAEDAAVYVEPNDVDGYARGASSTSLDDEPRRRAEWASSAASGSSRSSAWTTSSGAYVRLDGRSCDRELPVEPSAGIAAAGRRRASSRATRAGRRADVCGVAGAYQQPDGKVARPHDDRPDRPPRAGRRRRPASSCDRETAVHARRTGGCRSSTSRRRPTSRSSRTA